MALNSRAMIASLSVSAATIVGIAVNEGYEGTAYKDSVGVPTIGFGETKDVKIGQSTDPVRALVDLQQAIDRHVKGMEQCVHVPLTQNEFDAYTDLIYNIGVANFCNSNLVSQLNKGNYKEACEQILRWNRAGGKVLPGLTKRRQKEYEQCSGQPSALG